MSVPSRSPSHQVAVGAAALAAVVVIAAAGTVIGPSSVPVRGALLELVDRLPLVQVGSGLSEQQATIVWELRFPRVVLGMLIGAMLSTAGGAYQGVFRNPLADPYLLGVAAGAGLGATLMIVQGAGAATSTSAVVPAAAFVGAMGAVVLTYAVGVAGDRRRSPASLVLAGVAVTSLLTALQTFVQQREVATIREVYAWIFGRLSTAGWGEVRLLLPYVAVSSVLLLVHGRTLDVLSVGDDEARSLGIRVDRVRLLVVTAASLGTAAAVAAGGLIGFVGIIVPHTVRLVGVVSYRWVLPASMVLGAGFLVLADLLARTALAPAEVPIGVVTALFGAPFFIMLLRVRPVGATA